MQPYMKLLAVLSVPFLLAAHFVAFNVLMWGGLALLFAFNSSCGSYGACLTESSGFMLLLGIIGFVLALLVLGLWTRWVAETLNWPWLLGRSGR